YIGVAPDKHDKLDTRQTLRSRIKRHYRGDAKGPTLRRTLGVLLEPQSGFPLRRVGSGNRITLTRAWEGYLNQWMEENAFVVWGEHPEPWAIEHALLQEISCPLNIKDNERHPFVATLKAIYFARPRRRGGRMRRREFITLFGVATVAWPLTSHAQQAGKMYRVGVLSPGPDLASPQWEAFEQGLREEGFVESRNFSF